MKPVNANSALFFAGLLMLCMATTLIVLTHPDIGFVSAIRQALMLQTPIEISRLEIPRLLHYAAESEFLPLEFRRSVNSCIVQNPGWTVQLWTNSDVLQLLQRHWPQLLHVYSKLDGQAERETLARFPILFIMGGVFLEPDVMCVRPLDSAARMAVGGAFLAADRPENARILENAPFRLSLAAMGSTPRHGWLAFAIDAMSGRERLRDDDLYLGEKFFSDCYQLWLSRGRPMAKEDANLTAISLNAASPQSPVLLPWEFFSPTLRDPDSITRLCRQLKLWPSLGKVYTERQGACRSLGASRSSFVASNGTIGYRQYEHMRALRLAGLKTLPKNRLFNATAQWQLTRCAHET